MAKKEFIIALKKFLKQKRKSNKIGRKKINGKYKFSNVNKGKVFSVGNDQKTLTCNQIFLSNK